MVVADNSNNNPQITTSKCADLMEISHAATFRRHLKKFTPTSKCCAICKFKFSTQTEFVIHFKEHGNHFLIRTLDGTFKMEKRLFRITVDLDAAYSSFTIKLENVFNQKLTVTEIYLYNSFTIGLEPIIVENKKDLNPSSVWTFQIPFTHFRISKHKYSLLIKTENVVFELVEHYHLKLKQLLNLKSRDTTGGTLQFKDTHMYPVANCIRNLYCNDFKTKTTYSTEEKELLDQIG